MLHHMKVYTTLHYTVLYYTTLPVHFYIAYDRREDVHCSIRT